MLTIKGAAALGVSWSVALASAGALTLAMRTPVASRATEVPAPQQVRAVEPPQATEVAVEALERQPIQLDPVFIVSTLAPTRRHAAPARVAPVAEPKCGEFRGLLQGSATQRVRVCE